MSKLDGYVRPYRGGQDDLDSFWAKFQVVAVLQKWDTGEKRMANLPLFLDGEAFTVYNEMSASDRKDPDKVKGKFQQAFGMTVAQAYSRFTKRLMRADESIDNYAADLKRLLSASGQVADDSNPVLIEQFISGLPRDFARELRMNGTRSTVSDCVEYVRRLRSAEESSGRAVTAYGGGTGGYGSSRHRQQSGSGRPGKQVLCFNCQTVGHYARDCPQPRKAGASRSRPVQCQCHFCDGMGHIISECEAFRDFKRNKSGKTAVVAAGGSSKKEASGPSEPEDASTVSLDDDRPVLCMPAPEGD